MKPTTIYYATSSEYKKAELAIIEKQVSVPTPSGGKAKIGEVCRFVASSVQTDEPLEIDLEAMVRHKVRSAYRNLLMPCIVEHAGLILENDGESGFPGGLTQPMWDALSADGFLRRTLAAGERARARAVVGYCNGTAVKIFVGETLGTIAESPRGKREFYWDTIFCPDGLGDRTYAEVAEETDGLELKVSVSQSMKAVKGFVTHLAKEGAGALFGEA